MMYKVISYSLWGDDPVYTVGAKENIWGQKELYPDWICRIYCHHSVDLKLMKWLDKHAEVVIINEKPFIDSLHRPMCWWRLNALADKTIDRVIFRDIDSRLSMRERKIVQEWEDSGEQVHIIRDHKYHGCRILTGMFGVTGEFINRIDYHRLVNEFKARKYICSWSEDQEFLAMMIYPLAKESMIIHDNNHKFLEEKVLKIKDPIINNHFIGDKITPDNELFHSYTKQGKAKKPHKAS